MPNAQMQAQVHGGKKIIIKKIQMLPRLVDDINQDKLLAIISGHLASFIRLHHFPP